MRYQLGNSLSSRITNRITEYVSYLDEFVNLEGENDRIPSDKGRRRYRRRSYDSSSES